MNASREERPSNGLMSAASSIRTSWKIFYLASAMVLSPMQVSALDRRVGEVASLHFYTPTPSHTIPNWNTATSTRSASSATPTVFLTFADMGNTTVCGQETITWWYTGDTSNSFALAVSEFSTDSSDENDGDATMILLSKQSILAGPNSYNWSSVNVNPGTYAFEVSIPNANVLYYSDPITVSDSTDHSCLSTQSPSSSTPTGASTLPATTSDGSSGDSSGIPVVGATSSGSAVSRGGIAGIVIGSLAFVVGALIALWFFRRRKGPSRSMGGGLFDTRRKPKGAVSISSRTGSFSSMHAEGRSDGNVHNPGYLDLTGEKRQHSSFSTGYGLAMPGAAHRSPYEHRNSIGSGVSSSTGVGAGSSISHHQYRPSRHSSLLYSSDPFSSAVPSPRQSIDQGQVPVALYSPTSSGPSTHSFNLPNVPHDVSSPSSSIPDFKDLGTEITSPPNALVARSGSGREPTSPQESSTSQARRTKSASARKPVPVYKPSHDEEMELVAPTSPRSYSHPGGARRNDPHHRGSSITTSSIAKADSRTSSVLGNDWSSAAAHSHSPVSCASATPNSSRSHLPRRESQGGSSVSEYGLMGVHRGLPELNHKSSFGERQMHVLMPDPPSREMQ